METLFHLDIALDYFLKAYDIYKDKYEEQKTSDAFPMIYAQNIVEKELSSPSFEDGITVYYKSPFGNKLTVQSTATIQSLEIFNLMGQRVFHKNVNQQKIGVHTSDWKSGMNLKQHKRELIKATS